ncbi:MAG: hypothetical protein GY725_20500, partial [bacterium]|nr:hypothetical protein [bacterium]
GAVAVAGGGKRVLAEDHGDTLAIVACAVGLAGLAYGAFTVAGIEGLLAQGRSGDTDALGSAQRVDFAGFARVAVAVARGPCRVDAVDGIVDTNTVVFGDVEPAGLTYGAVAVAGGGKRVLAEDHGDTLAIVAGAVGLTGLTYGTLTVAGVEGVLAQGRSGDTDALGSAQRVDFAGFARVAVAVTRGPCRVDAVDGIVDTDTVVFGDVEPAGLAYGAVAVAGGGKRVLAEDHGDTFAIVACAVGLAGLAYGAFTVAGVEGLLAQGRSGDTDALGGAQRVDFAGFARVAVAVAANREGRQITGRLGLSGAGGDPDQHQEDTQN